jgi:biopolymer transport protein ExbD
MKRRSRKQNLVAEINITPFTDVILVLLVIFMITTPLISQSNIKVDLPKAKSGQPVEAGQSSGAEIIVTREGPVYLDGKVVTRKEMGKELEDLKKENHDLSVVVRSDKTVRFQDIVNVLDMLTELGITKLKIAATAQE